MKKEKKILNGLTSQQQIIYYINVTICYLQFHLLHKIVLALPALFFVAQ